MLCKSMDKSVDLRYYVVVFIEDKSVETDFAPIFKAYLKDKSVEYCP